MPLPTVVFLNNHFDPSTYQFLAKACQAFKERGYTDFIDEENEEWTLEHTIRLHQGYAKLLDDLKKGTVPPIFSSFPQIIQKVRDQAETILPAINFYLILKKEKLTYLAGEYDTKDLIDTLAMSERLRWGHSRERLYASLYWQRNAFSRLGLAHLEGLQDAIINIGEKEFKLSQDETSDLFVFVYLYRHPPLAVAGDIDRKVRRGEMTGSLGVHCFDMNQCSLEEVRESIFKIIDLKAAKPALMRFRSENQTRLKMIYDQERKMAAAEWEDLLKVNELLAQDPPGAILYEKLQFHSFEKNLDKTFYYLGALKYSLFSSLATTKTFANIEEKAITSLFSRQLQINPKVKQEVQAIMEEQKSKKSIAPVMKQ